MLISVDTCTLCISLQMANGRSCNGMRFWIRWKIDMFYSTRRSRVEENVDRSPTAKSCIIAGINAICHLCCTKPRMLTKLNKIDKNLVPWMSQKKKKFSSWLNIARARPTRNAYFIHKTISVCDKIMQIHTIMPRKVIVTSCTAGKWYVTAWLCNGTIRCTFSSQACTQQAY